ncbi:MAG: hypothetical protein U0572_06770 [Phycisphaerales bacterium]
MTRRRSAHALLTLAMAAPSILAASQIASAQCRYTAMFVADYQCPGSWSEEAFVGTRINAHGTWAGYRRHCPPNDSVDVPVVCGFGETPVELPLPPGVDNAQALGISDDGVVVGLVWPLQTYGAIWIGDRIEIIPPGPGGLDSVANAVNLSLQVAGTRGIGKQHVDSHVAFIWQDGVMTDIGPAGFFSSYAFDISNGGTVVGYMGSPSIDARGFRWFRGKTCLLPPFEGALTSVAYSVNDAGWIAGACRVATPLGLAARPALWIGSAPSKLSHEPGYKHTVARAINNSNVIVGAASVPLDPGEIVSMVGLLWIDDARFRLQDLVGPAPFYCFDAFDINDAGQILAVGSTPDAIGLCILTPIEPPLADLTGDCMVDGADLAALLDAWGPGSPIADLNSDSQVDAKDLSILLGAWSTAR